MSEAGTHQETDVNAPVDESNADQNQGDNTDRGIVGSPIGPTKEPTGAQVVASKKRSPKGLIVETGKTMPDDETSPREGRIIFKPDEPTMGGLAQTKAEDFVAWTGGKPKHDWSGLDDKADKEPTRSLQVRTLTDKRYLDRITGPAIAILHVCKMSYCVTLQNSEWTQLRTFPIQPNQKR